MQNFSQKDIDWLLNLHRHGDSQTAKQSKSGWKRVVVRIALAAASLFGLIVFPFLLLVRLSVYLNLNTGLPAWVSLMGGIAGTICLLIIYLFALSFKVENKRLMMKTGILGSGTMVLGYCLFSLFYLSGIHAKSADVQSVYRSMHPILRVAVSTVTLADNDLVITDIERINEDYERMGLRVNPTSMHYRQSDGYVHAVDIRTLGRGSVRNGLLQGSLELMGFRTLRHTGTADHLHVELGQRPEKY